MSGFRAGPKSDRFRTTFKCSLSIGPRSRTVLGGTEGPPVRYGVLVRGGMA